MCQWALPRESHMLSRAGRAALPVQEGVYVCGGCELMGVGLQSCPFVICSFFFFFVVVHSYFFVRSFLLLFVCSFFFLSSFLFVLLFLLSAPSFLLQIFKEKLLMVIQVREFGME